MMLKKSKEEVLANIQAQVYGDICSQLGSMSGHSVNNFGNLIASAVAHGVEKAMKILIEETYTHQDFEKDIGLR